MKYFSIVLLFAGLIIFAGQVQAQGNKPFKINTSTTSGGMVTPRVANLKLGDSKQFTLQPEVGYRVVGVSGCGGTYDASTFTFTTAPASADCEIYASFHAGSNQVPTVSVDADMTVEIGSTVILTGTATDSDGSIDSTSWQQISGTTTTSSQTADTITFVAGEVTGDTPLVFEFTATDNEGALASASVQVTVINSTPASLPLVFSDEFDDGIDDLTKWNFQGYRGWLNEITAHTETGGSLKISMDTTDEGAQIQTIGLPTLTKIKIVMRHYMHAANNYYFPGIVLQTIDTQKVVALSMQRTQYSQGFCDTGINYDKVLLLIPGINGQKCFEQQFVSNITSSSLYDQWIISTIEYDSETGEFVYDIGDDGIVDFSVTVPSNHLSPVSGLLLTTYGWFTGHYHTFDYIRVYGQ